MKIRETIHSGVLAALFLAGAALAQPPGSGAGMVDHLAAVLGLTDAQKAAASKLHASFETDAAPLIQQSKLQWAEIETLLESANPDATEIGERVIAAHATQARLKALHDDFHARLSTILTADQTAKLGQLEAARRQREGGRPGPPPPGI